MSDDALHHLPQSPRPALEADIVQLAPDGLTRLFRESLPTHPALSPAEARVALAMHRAGHDAAAIAERSRAPLPAVMAFLDSIKSAEEKRAQLNETSHALPLRRATASSQPDDREPEQLEADALPIESTPATKPAPAAPPKLTQPDIELTDLQLAMIRRLRKARVPASAIAFGMRLTPDQVMRVTGEIP